MIRCSTSGSAVAVRSLTPDVGRAEQAPVHPVTGRLSGNLEDITAADAPRTQGGKLGQCTGVKSCRLLGVEASMACDRDAIAARVAPALPRLAWAIRSHPQTVGSLSIASVRA